MIKTEIIIALLSLAGVLISSILAGIFLVVNTRLGKKVDVFKSKKEENNLFAMENNILGSLVPVLEKKDLAIDRLAEAIEDLSLRIKLLEQEEVTTKTEGRVQREEIKCMLEKRCEAPILIKHLQKLHDEKTREEMRKELLNIERTLENGD